MSNNSLKQYNQNFLTNAGNPSNNFSRPNLNPNNGGLLEFTNVGNVLNGTQKYNKYDWYTQYTKDPILNFGSTSTNISGGSNTFANVLGVITGLFSAGLMIFQGVSLFKSSKTNTTAQNSVDENLSSLTERANGYEKDSDLSSMQNTAINIRSAIRTAQTRLDNAKRGKLEAETKITNLNSQKEEFRNQLDDFKTGKAELETNIESDKTALAELEAIPEEQRTPEQTQKITQLKTKIQEQEDTLKKEYSDNKQKTLENQIIRIDKEIQEWTKKQEEYEEELKRLPAEIKEAESAEKKLRKKINKKNK